MKFFFPYLFLLFPVSFFSQQVLSGKVVDSRVKSPLAFVSIQLVGTNSGTLTDIDGKFSITIPAGNTDAQLNFVYLGYQTKSLKVSSVANPSDFIVELKTSDFVLKEVTVQAKENPAHRIIKNVTRNRDNNNPEKMRSFSYVSYNKMYVTADMNDKGDTASTMDTLSKGLGKVLKKQHLFLTESVSERKYLHPGKNNEKVLASRVSGFKNSPFTMLATQMQSFSFYDDFINVFDKHYLNPVSEGSTKKYFFQLEDTLYQGNDSVFVISFRPKKDKNFDGMKGVLYINTDGWAIQNVIAEPVDRQGAVSIKIQQQYEKIEGKQWFPSKLNTDWIYLNTTIGDSSISVGSTESSVGKIKAIARTYISQISLNPEIKRKEFSEVELEMTSEADKRTEEFWNQYRIDSLTKKDENTYKKIDSIGKKENFDKKLLFFEALSSGKWNLGYFDLDIGRVLSLNDYEGLRLGAGFHTSNKLSKRINVGGYAAFGFKDLTLKYGGDLNFLLWKKKELVLHAVYENDVIEAGGQKFFENRRSFVTSEAYRDYYVRKMDRYVKYELSADWRMFKYFRVNLFADHQQRWSERSYLLYDERGEATFLDTFGVNEAGLKIKFIFREKFMQTPRAKISMGSDHPIIYLNVTQGIKNEINGLKGDFEYTRVDFRLDDAYQFRTLGRLNISLHAGKVIGDVPYGFQYAMRSSHYPKFSLSAMNTFETMRMNEFTSSEFVSMFINHNFGKFLKKRKKFNPELELVHNMGIGRLDNPYVHYNIGLKSMEKGFFESGVRINNILKQNFLGYGVSVLYRYGPYAFSTWDKNIYARFNIGFSF